MATGGFFQGGTVLKKQIELAVSTGNAPQVLGEFQNEINLVNGQLRAIEAQFRHGLLPVRDYLDQTASLTRQSTQLGEAIRGLNQIIATGQIQMAGMSRQTAAAGRAVLEFSRGLEDLTTAGPIGALNNIPTFFYNIGQSLNLPISQVNFLTAGTSVLATAVYALYKNFDTLTGHDPALRAFFNALGENLNPFHVDRYATSVENLEKRIKELQESKVHVAVDDLELQNLRKQLAEAKKDFEALEAAMKRQTTAERESGKRVEEILATQGGREGLEAARTQRVAEFRAQVERGPIGQEVANLRRRIDEAAAEAARGNTFAEASIPALQEQLHTAITNMARAQFEQARKAQESIGNLVRAATSGTGQAQVEAQQQLASLLGGRPGIPGMAGQQVVGGPTTVAGQIAAASPEAMAAEKQLEEQAAAIRNQRQRAANERREAEQANARVQQEAKKKEDKETLERDQAARRRRDAAAQADREDEQEERLRRRRGQQAGQQIGRTAQQYGAGVMPEIEQFLLQMRAARAQAQMLPPRERARAMRQIPSEEQAQRFAAGRVARGLQQAGAPGTRGDQAYAESVAGQIVANAQQKSNASVLRNQALGLNLMGAIQATQMEMVGHQQQHFNLLMRLWNNQNMVQRNMRNNRQTQQSLPR